METKKLNLASTEFLCIIDEYLDCYFYLDDNLLNYLDRSRYYPDFKILHSQKQKSNLDSFSFTELQDTLKVLQSFNDYNAYQLQLQNTKNTLIIQLQHWITKLNSNLEYYNKVLFLVNGIKL